MNCKDLRKNQPPSWFMISEYYDYTGKSLPSLFDELNWSDDIGYKDRASMMSADSSWSSIIGLS